MITMVCVFAVVLTACGGGSDQGGNTGGGGGAAETYDVGAFTISVPSGWTVFPQTDIFGETNEDGTEPIDPESILLAKGANDEFDAYSKPSVRIYYYSPDTIVMDSKDFYDDVQELEGVTVNGVECEAFSGDSLGYVYQLISYVTDDAQYEISILISNDGKETGITWEDADVKAIMESITTK